MARSKPEAVRPGRKRVDFDAFRRLTELADYFVPFMIRAVCELGIADELARGPRTVDDLAAATRTDGPSLRRVLRVLVRKGVLTESADGYELTSVGDLLRSDHPLSLRDAYLVMPADALAWTDLAYSLRTGLPAFERVHGETLWEYLGRRPEESLRFDRGMQAMNRSELRAVSSAYDWSAFQTVVDVGGGNGAFLAGLLSKRPALRGVLIDLPHVVAHARSVLVDAGVAERCEVVAGSFFEEVPRGGDAYVLKRILYAWNDEAALRLVRSVRAAMHRDSRMLVVEPVVGVAGSEFGEILDVVMLAIDGGRARSEDELEALFSQAGLELTRVVPTMTYPIVEARAR